MNSNPLRISLIIPVHNGGTDLHHCLKALMASTRTPDEVIVVDDASSDNSGELAQRFGTQVISLPDGPQGPARARNQGALSASGDILIFVDADVAVHPDTVARMERYLSEQPNIAALFGSYDADPPARGFVTRYKNLLHHYVHQHSKQEASTFWAGCGAIRRDVFDTLGGFDESYDRPAIEDIELGTRLKRAGHLIRLCQEIQVTHLKRWSFASLLRSDILDRAVPWTHLVLQGAHLPADLNFDVKSRLSALVAWIMMLFLALAALFTSSWALGGALLAMLTLGILNFDLYRFFAHKEGMGFAVGAAALHLLYLLYSSLTFLVMVGPAWLARHGSAPFSSKDHRHDSTDS